LRTASNSIRRARPLLGTFVEITVADAAISEMHAAVDAAFAAVGEVHSLMSFHVESSEVARLNREAFVRTVAVHPWTFQVLEAAIDLHQRSAGVFDIAVAPVLQEMGLLPRLRDCRTWTPGPGATTAAIELVSGRRVRFKHPDARIDLGGIAKGFAVERAIDVLRHCGMPAAIVNAGGDLAVFGSKPHTVYIRDPRDPRRSMCQVRVRSGALASSGSYFDPFGSSQPVGSAVIDPSSRKPACTALAATVRAPSCMLADALTKVVMVAGPSAADVLEHYRADALVVAADGNVQMTRDLRSAVSLAA
jgi:thiamine biosynthesis lipoprotein